MAIDDNTSYELTGYQVKDLAQKIRAKADSSSLASVATSGLYSDLIGTPTIPTVYNGKLTIQQNGVEVGTFTANQNSDATINLTGGGSTYTAGNGINIDANDEISIDTSVVAELSDLPTKTSDLSNDGSDGTSTYVEADDYATAAAAGVIKATSSFGVDMSNSGEIKGTVVTSANYPSMWNDAIISKGTLENALSTKNYATMSDLPTVNDATLTITQNGTSAGTFTANSSSNTTIALTDTTYSDFTGASSSVAGAAGLVPAPAAGDDTKFLSGDGLWKTVSVYSLPIASSSTLGGIKVGSNLTIDPSTGVLDATDTTYSDFTGSTASADGTSGLVPQPLIVDKDKFLKGDGTWSTTPTKLVEMSYGESSAWTKFINAYQAGSIVYCRASSNANPATGSQTRKAFMAYVNDASNPTSVEFQYVRSVSSKSDSQQCDQVFVYTLKNTNGGTWSVASRDMATKVNVDSTLTKTYSAGANASMTLGAKTMTGATSSVAGTAGLVPAPAAGDQDKVLSGAGTWVTQSGGGTTYTAGAHIDITGNVISAEDYISADSPTAAVSPSSPITTAMISNGAVTSAKIATGVVPVITMTDTDPGEGSPLADNNFIAVYGDDPNSMDYSLVEVNTGATWIDGSPIYKKTINFGALPNATEKTTAHNISDLSLVIKAEGFFYNPNSNVFSPFPQNFNGNSNMYNGCASTMIIDVTNIRIGCTTNMSTNTAYITLYYTKSS